MYEKIKVFQIGHNLLVLIFVNKFQDSYYEEYRMYDLGNLAVAVAIPLIREHLKPWQALEDPLEPVALFQQWKDILEIDKRHGTDQDPYQKLIWEAWMPSVRAVIKYVHGKCLLRTVILIQMS